MANPDASIQYAIDSYTGLPSVSFEKEDGTPPPFFAVDVLEPQQKKNYAKAMNQTPPAAVFYASDHIPFAQLVQQTCLPTDAIVEAIIQNLPKSSSTLTPRHFIELSSMHMGRVLLASLKHRRTELDPSIIEDRCESHYIDGQIQLWESCKDMVLPKENYYSEEERDTALEICLTHHAPHAFRVKEGDEPVALLLMNTLHQQGQISSFFYEVVTNEIKQQIENAAQHAFQQWQNENPVVESGSPWTEKLGPRTGMDGRGIDSDNEGS